MELGIRCAGLQERGEVGAVLVLAGQDAVALLELQAVKHLRV